MVPSPVLSDPSSRVERFTRGTNLAWVADLLAGHRDEIVSRWVVAAAAQPFHAARPEGAVADHIPRLFDALVALLRRHAPAGLDAEAPLDDPAIVAAAQAHAGARLDQGLAIPAIATEFRLLRQEIGRALRFHLPARSPARDIVGAELLVHDALDGAVFLALTTFTQHADEREAARAALEREKEAFLTALAHDLKNPLTVIRGAAQMLQRQGRTRPVGPEQLAASLATIETAATQVAAQVNELLSVARQDAAETPGLERRRVDLVALARRVAAAYQQGTEEHRIRVHATESALVGWLDPARIERVFANLLGNAIKYSPARGEIDVTLRRGTPTERPAGEPHQASEPAGWAVVTVRDRGIGIPAADLPRIFERFHRGGNVTRIAGLGIGLAAARQVVEQHGGTIAAESQEGHGTTITVRLPLIAP